MPMNPNPSFIPLVDGFGYIDNNGVITKPKQTGQSVGCYAFYKSRNGVTKYVNWAQFIRDGYPPPPNTSYSSLFVWDKGSGYNWDYREYSINYLGQKIETYHIVRNWNNTCYVETLPQIASYGHLPQALTKCRARFAEKVNGMSVNLAQAFGERKQTARLIADTATSILDAARALKRGDVGRFLNSVHYQGKKGWSGRNISSDFSKRWLEYTYGWKPLLQDVYGSIEALNHKITSDGLRIRASAKEFDQGRWVYDMCERSLKRQSTAKLVYNVKCQDQLKAVAANTGISNPALLAWELLPWSFVIDWFIPVGNYLESLTAFDGFSFKDGCQVLITRGDYFSNHSSKSYSTYNRQNIVSGWRRREYLVFDRTATGASLPPAIPPSFRSPLGGDPISRFTTAFSLMRGLFKR